MSVQCISVSNKRHFHVSVVEVKVEVEVEVEAAVVYRVTHLQMLITILHCGFEEEMSLQVPLLWQTTQNICRPGVGLPAISNVFDTAGRRRAGIGSTHDARPMPRFLELT